MAEHPIKQPFFHVVSCDVHDDNTTVLNLRAHGRWVYAEAKPSRIRNETLNAKYLELATAARQQQDGTHDQVVEASVGRPDEFTKTEKRDPASNGHDSGYSSDKSSSSQTSPAPNQSKQNAEQDAEQELRQFLVDSLDWTLDEASIHGTPPRERSLADWYDTSILLYYLEAGPDDKDLLRPVPRDDLDGQKYIRQTLTPHISLPKYLRNMSGIPWYSPSDLTVLEEEHNIHLSIHPTVVRLPRTASDTDTKPTSDDNISNTETSGTPNLSTQTATPKPQTAFLKLATALDEPAIKREIKLLHTLQKLSLYDQGIRAPRLLGIVPIPSSPNSRASMLGFLITHIEQPVSLLGYMSTSVPAARRESLAASVDNMVHILHAHNLVWGDAKADNFVIDRNGDGDLWMIDFGGSYTPGWIDKTLEGTREGDEMGTERIINGLGDPVGCVMGEEEEEIVEAERAEAGRVEVERGEAKRGEQEVVSCGGNGDGDGEGKETVHAGTKRAREEEEQDEMEAEKRQKT